MLVQHLRFSDHLPPQPQVGLFLPASSNLASTDLPLLLSLTSFTSPHLPLKTCYRLHCQIPTLLPSGVLPSAVSLNIFSLTLPSRIPHHPSDPLVRRHHFPVARPRLPISRNLLSLLYLSRLRVLIFRLSSLREVSSSREEDRPASSRRLNNSNTGAGLRRSGLWSSSSSTC